MSETAAAPGTASPDTLAPQADAPKTEAPAGAAPVVSVILPVYKRIDLRKALSSVLAQGYKDFEVLVVDDGSPVPVSEALLGFDDPRIRYLRCDPNRGCAAARNRGLNEARGRYIAFQDSDDEWCLGHLEALVAAMEAAPPQVGLTYGNVIRQVPGRLYFLPDFPPDQRDGPMFDLALRHGVAYVQTWLVRRELFAQAGLFDTSMKTSSDWEMFLRLAALCEMRYVPESMVVSVMQEDSVSRVKPAKVRMYTYVYSKLEGSMKLTREQRGDMLYQLAKCYCGERDFAGARRHLVKMLLKHPDHLRAWLLLAAASGGMRTWSVARRFAGLEYRI